LKTIWWHCCILAGIQLLCRSATFMHRFDNFIRRSLAFTWCRYFYASCLNGLASSWHFTALFYDSLRCSPPFASSPHESDQHFRPYRSYLRQFPNFMRHCLFFCSHIKKEPIIIIVLSFDRFILIDSFSSGIQLDAACGSVL
jgi:hypothetical protein